ncbi:hypothetical protein [Siphonobacter curvatus]|uniref:O-antigen polymerase n=1 Tax=Siphonobacter curvatus TaxID=2094562 RepID=A0A2S7IKQ8_9BACT|nr:hypothetical protein [Siphonobacter curvatus]PQA58314.1 hypothetical protein C5O19_01155 [Siphonobacter curvatus]
MLNEIIRQVTYIKDRITFKQWFFIVAILSISVDGFPLFPVSSNNRPLSIIFIFIYYFIDKVEKKYFYKYEVHIYIFYLILWVFTYLKAFYAYHDYRGLIKFTVTGVFGVVSVCSCLSFYQEITDKYKITTLINILVYSLILSSILPLLVGFLQYLSLINILPYSFVNFITLLFSYRPLEDRIQLLNTEPAQAGTFLIFVFFNVMAFYNDNERFKVFLLIIIFIFIVILSSSLTYMTFLFALLLYIILFKKINIYKFIKFIMVLFVLSLLLFFVSSYFLTDYTLNKLIFIKDLIVNFDEDYIDKVFLVDFSSFDRLTTPITGFASLEYSYFMGAGGESFFYLYEDIILDRYAFMLKNTDLQEILINNMQSPKFLYSKIVADFGIILFTAVSFFTYKMFSILKKYYSSDTLIKSLSLCVTNAVVSTHMASYFNFQIILIICLFVYYVFFNGRSKFIDKI